MSKPVTVIDIRTGREVTADDVETVDEVAATVFELEADAARYQLPLDRLRAGAALVVRMCSRGRS